MIKFLNCHDVRLHSLKNRDAGHFKKLVVPGSEVGAHDPDRHMGLRDDGNLRRLVEV